MVPDHPAHRLRRRHARDQPEEHTGCQQQEERYEDPDHGAKLRDVTPTRMLSLHRRRATAMLRLQYDIHNS